MTQQQHPLDDAHQWHSMRGIDRMWYALGVGLGSGLASKAPGTVASFAVLILVPLWVYLGLWPSIGLIGLMSLVGIPICGKTAHLMGVHDDGRIVWDEFVGQSITLLPLVALGLISATMIGMLHVLIAFMLFRLFDIWKPWPIGELDRRVHGGFGIMLDDVLAGVFAAVAVWSWAAYVWPWIQR